MNFPYVAGKYALLRKIASGGMAEVFLAKQVGLDGFEKLVVLKRILPHLAHQPEYVRMFLDEAKTAADLRHSNLVGTFEIGEDHGVYFMVMEFLYGQDVRTVYKTAIAQKVEVPLHFTVGILIDACAGLHYAHTKRDLSGKKLGIVHRDISPQNMIVTYEGETKIVDFGIAKAAHQKTETASGVLKGKYSYMSPEQAMGQHTDHRTDIFALGIVLFEMTTLRRLFRKESEALTLRGIVECQVPLPSSFVPSYPKVLERIVMRALAKDKEERYQSCQDLRVDLEDFLAQQRVAHSPPRLGHFMRQLFQDRIEKEKSLSAEDTDALSALFWTGSYSASNPKTKEKVDTISTRIDALPKRRRSWAGQATLALLFFGIASLFVTLAWFGNNSPKVEQLSALNKAHAPSVDDFFELETRSLPQKPPIAPAVPAPKPKQKIEFGRLKVVVKPWAEVYLDDVKIGATPFAAKKLPEGTYQIRLENPKLQKKLTQSITITPGRDTLVRHDW
jgi:serine/threonine protein kinase